MSHNIYMALRSMGPILKIRGASCGSTAAEMPLPLNASHCLLAFVTQGLSVALSAP